MKWANLNSIGNYLPALDYPQPPETVRGWLRDAGLEDIRVQPETNGVVCRGRPSLSDAGVSRKRLSV